MKLNIPSGIAGIDGKTAYEKIMNEKEPEANKNINPVFFSGNFVKSDYVQIPGQNFVIAIAETDFGLNYENANKAVLKRGLYVPYPKEFMAFYNHLINSYKDKKPIFDAGGNSLPDKVKEELYTQLTSNCWTWLNGKFNISGKKNSVDYVVGLDSNDNLLTKTENLEDCLMEDRYIDFTKLTKDGLASINSKASNQKYVKGENIYFWFPRNERVARFYSGDSGAALNCDGDPSGRVDNRGVRAVRRWAKALFTMWTFS